MCKFKQTKTSRGEHLNYQIFECQNEIISGIQIPERGFYIPNFKIPKPNAHPSERAIEIARI